MIHVKNDDYNLDYDHDSAWDNDRRDKIVADHPLLYKHIKHFECRDGWLDIIERLSDKLEREIKEFYIKYEIDKDYQPIYASQIKEKYGSLRFYMSCGTDEMFNLIDDAESESASACELCGKPGHARSGSWYQTLCNDHAKQKGCVI
jgi:hypothetical protein